MKTVGVADFKTQFSDLLNKVRRGEHIAIQYGRRKETVAILIPAHGDNKLPKRMLGVLQGTASFKLGADFKMTEKDFLSG